MLPTCVKDGKVISERDDDDFNIVYDVKGIENDCLCFGKGKLDGEKNKGCKEKEGSTCVVPANTAYINGTGEKICTSQLGGTWIQPVDRVGTKERPFTSCEDFQNNPIDPPIVYYNSDTGERVSRNDVSLGDVYYMLGITSNTSDLTDACNVGYTSGNRGDCNIYAGEDPAGTTNPFYGNALARACLIGTDLKNNVDRKGWYLTKIGDKHVCKPWTKCDPETSSMDKVVILTLLEVNPPHRLGKANIRRRPLRKQPTAYVENSHAQGDNCKWPETSAYYPRGEGESLQTNSRWRPGLHAGEVDVWEVRGFGQHLAASRHQKKTRGDLSHFSA